MRRLRSRVHQFHPIGLAFIKAPCVAGYTPSAAHKVDGFFLFLALHQDVYRPVKLRPPGQISDDRPAQHHFPRFWHQEVLGSLKQVKQHGHVGFSGKSGIGFRALFGPMIVASIRVIAEPQERIVSAGFILFQVLQCCRCGQSQLKVHRVLDRCHRGISHSE